MANTLPLQISFPIRASRAAVWDALTKPELVKQYFFGTELETDWQPGSPIFFRGQWDGKAYEDKGHILAIEPGEFVTYNYWSSWSTLPDLPENYADITYRLTEDGDHTLLTITQTGHADEAARQQSEKNWRGMIDALKGLVETP